MKDGFITIRIDAETKAALEVVAKAEMRSLSSQALLYIMQAVKQVEPAKAVKRSTSLDIPDGVSEQTWDDFKRLRAAKKSPVTARAVEGIAKEAMKAGMTLEAALRECCARGWAGFKAEWVQSKQDQVAALLRPSTTYLEME